MKKAGEAMTALPAETFLTQRSLGFFFDFSLRALR
jgi:hypothetical protein